MVKHTQTIWRQIVRLALKGLKAKFGGNRCRQLAFLDLYDPNSLVLYRMFKRGKAFAF